MDLAIGRQLFEQCLQDPYIRGCYDAGDNMRAGQTKHGFAEHAVPVVEKARAIAEQIRAQRPGLIDDWTYAVVIPFGALLHDIGGCISIENHDKDGCKLMRPYLKQLTLPGSTETLDEETQNRILRIIAYHRAGRYLGKQFEDVALDVVLLADKSVGDDDRVRPVRAFILKLLSWIRLACIPLRSNGAHDRINFAIQHADLVANGATMVLSLTVKDAVLEDSPLLFWLPRQDKYAVIYNHDYFKKNLHSMETAAAHLGYQFFLEFNGVRYEFDRSHKTWKPAGTR